MKKLFIFLTMIIFVQLVGSAVDKAVYKFEDCQDFSISSKDDHDSIKFYSVDGMVFLSLLIVQKHKYSEYQYTSMNISMHDYIYYPLPHAPPLTILTSQV